MTNGSLLSFYQDNKFNPVPIALDSRSAWESQVAKRCNLYKRHLGIPLSLLNNQPVLEFGCNSGENALVLAANGANLTLVEPNDQVLPRLRELFQRYDLQKHIVDLRTETIAQFETQKRFSLIIAEGFLPFISNREEMLNKIISFLAPGGIMVINFVDRFGSLLEMTRGLIFRRACQLANVEINSNVALEIAYKLYGEDFTRSNASRPFQAWITDNFVDPYFTSHWLWSYQEIIPLIEAAGCEVHSTSPVWSSLDHFSWYKKTQKTRQIHNKFMETWSNMFLYFLTGLGSSGLLCKSPSQEVINAVKNLTKSATDYSKMDYITLSDLKYPVELEHFLRSANVPEIGELNTELIQLFKAIMSSDMDNLINTYQASKQTRQLWGTPMHYLRVDKL